MKLKLLVILILVSLISLTLSGCIFSGGDDFTGMKKDGDGNVIFGGYVKDQDTGDPIKGAIVKFEAAWSDFDVYVNETTTDENGYYYKKMDKEHDRGAEYWIVYASSENHFQKSKRSKDNNDFNFELERGYRIEGKVDFKGKSFNKDEYSVCIGPSTRPDVIPIDKDGNFRSNLKKAGEYKVNVNSPTYAQTEWVEVTTPIEEDLVLDPPTTKGVAILNISSDHTLNYPTRVIKDGELVGGWPAVTTHGVKIAVGSFGTYKVIIEYWYPDDGYIHNTQDKTVEVNSSYHSIRFKEFEGEW